MSPLIAPLNESDEELQMLLEIAEKFETAKRLKGRDLNRTEKSELSGKETENIIRSHLLRRGLNLSRTREFLTDDDVGSMEIDLMLLSKGVNLEDPPYQPKDVRVVFEIKNNAVTDQTTRTKANFDRVKKRMNVGFAFVCLSERSSYKHRVTQEALGYPVFELVSRIRSRDVWMESKADIMAEVHRIGRSGGPVIWKTGSWAALINYLGSKQ
ncbi:MAG: hypothetical protein ABSA75_13150 [Candidatus Bathyarchaeia archaeon]|jgi:hypothetical protein